MTSKAKVVGRIYDELVYGGIRVAEAAERPDFWTVYKRVSEGESVGWKHLVDSRTKIEADEYIALM